jgi:hypothetical protein
VTVQAAATRRSRRRSGLRPAGRAVLLASAAAWVALAGVLVSGWAGSGDMHEHMHMSTALDAWSAGWVGMWLVMVAAMMWPLAVPTVDALSRATYAGWRTRLVLTCLATVTVLWLAAGLLVAGLAQLAGVPAGSGWWQLGWVAVALVALRSARRARLLWLCLQLPPLAPGGRRGLVSSVRAGLVTWRRCALLCGPVMAAMVVGHDPVLLVCSSLAVWWEAAHPRAWHDRVPVLLLAGAAAWLVLGEVWTGV